MFKNRHGFTFEWRCLLEVDSQPFLCQFVDETKRTKTRRPFDMNDFLKDMPGALSPTDSLSDKQLLILTTTEEREVDLVTMQLVERGIDYIRLNIEDIPKQLLIKYSMSRDAILKMELGVRDKQLDLSKVSLVWLRDFEIETRTLGKNKLAHIFSLQQWNDALQLLRSRLNCQWFPGNPQANNFNFLADRLEQLSAAKKLGFNIPQTVITNNPSVAEDFIGANGNEVVIKALHHHAVEIGNKRFSMYTHRVLKQDLQRLKDLIYAPCILQERLHKRSELRVTVVGKSIFAVKMDSQSSAKGRDDWHRASAKELNIKPFEINSELCKRCIKLVNSMGLMFGAIDFVIDENNRYVFLEVNPNASWLWIERITGFRITEAVTNLIEQMVVS